MNPTHTRTPSRFVALAATVAIALSTATPTAHASAVALPDFSDLVEQDGPAVVSIEAIHDGGKHKQSAAADDEQIPEIFKRFFGNPQMPMPREDEGTAIGSGFMISADGKILTNHHVVDGADRVIVHLADRREFTAKVIGSDPMSDVALLKVQATDLPYLKLADAKSLRPGQWVVAIGSPFGLDHSVTAGIVSAVGRRSLDPSQQYVPFIQTDVPINRGNSGGPLLNTRGEVVGINSQIFSNSGGYMGVSFAIPIEGEEIVSSSDLPPLVGSLPPGSRAKLSLRRDGKVLEVPVVLDNLADSTVAATVLPTAGKEPVANGAESLGLAVQEIAPAQRKTMKLEAGQGVLVARVVGDAARRAGVQPGDVVLRVGNREIGSIAAFSAAAAQAKPGDTLMLLLRRNEQTQFIALGPIEKG